MTTDVVTTPPLGPGGPLGAGKLPLPAALAEVRAADVMAFTSVQEGTPAAVLEALSFGVPVVCHDACGMGVAVTDDCGIRVPMVDVPTSVAGFAAALRRVRDEPGLLADLSAGAVRRTAELGWDQKARQIDDAYQRIAGQRGHRAEGGGQTIQAVPS